MIDCVGVRHPDCVFSMLKVTEPVLQAAGETVSVSCSVAPAVAHVPPLGDWSAAVMMTVPPTGFTIVAAEGFANGKKLSPQIRIPVVVPPLGMLEGIGPRTTFGCCVPMKEAVTVPQPVPEMIGIETTTLPQPDVAVGVTANFSVWVPSPLSTADVSVAVPPVTVPSVTEPGLPVAKKCVPVIVTFCVVKPTGPELGVGPLVMVGPPDPSEVKLIVFERQLVVLGSVFLRTNVTVPLVQLAAGVIINDTVVEDKPEIETVPPVTATFDVPHVTPVGSQTVNVDGVPVRVTVAEVGEPAGP